MMPERLGDPAALGAVEHDAAQAVGDDQRPVVGVDVRGRPVGGQREGHARNGAISASAIESPASRRTVAIRRPGCTAGRAAPSSGPASGVEVVDGDREAPEARRAAGLRDLDDQLAEADERHRRRQLGRRRRGGAGRRRRAVSAAAVRSRSSVKATTWSIACAPLGCAAARRRGRGRRRRAHDAAARRGARRAGPSTRSARTPPSPARPVSRTVRPPSANAPSCAGREAQRRPRGGVVGDHQLPGGGHGARSLPPFPDRDRRTHAWPETTSRAGSPRTTRASRGPREGRADRRTPRRRCPTRTTTRRSATPISTPTRPA